MEDREHGTFLRHGLIVMAGSLAACLSHVFFHMVMGRKLSVEEYSLMVFVLNAIMIFTHPMEALRTAMAHYASRFVHEGRPRDVMALARRWERKLGLVGLAIVLVAAVANPWLNEFFNLKAGWPIFSAGLVLSVSLFVPLYSGALQGLQSFAWMSCALHAWTLSRFVLGTIFVCAIAPAAVWGVVAQGIGILITVGLGIWGLRKSLGMAEAHQEHPEGAYRYFFKSFLVLSGFAILTSADILLAKRYFPDIAGWVAKAGTIARTLVYLSIPIVLAMFPKVASRGKMTLMDQRLLRKTMLYVGLLVAVSLGVAWIWPNPLTFVIYNIWELDPMRESIVRQFLLAMSPLPFVYILVNFEMAQHRFKGPLLFAATSMGYILGVVLFHDHIGQMLKVLLAMNVLSLLILLPVLFSKKNVEIPD